MILIARRADPLLALILLLAGPVCALEKAKKGDPAEPPRIELTGAEHHLKNFEDKVKRMRGQPFKLGPLENDALKKVWALKEKYPDNEAVEALFQRGRAAVMASKGEATELPANALEYREKEKKLQRLFLEVADKEWADFKAKLAEGDKLLKRAFPPPDHEEIAAEEITGKHVILERFEYPANQFQDGTKSFCFVGSGARGYYFVDLSQRAWLGAYEAVKRYRRQINQDVPEDLLWTVAGKITGLEMMVPQAGEQKDKTARWGWVVEPLAVYVPGRTFAVPKLDSELGGTFAGEAKMAELKDGMYTVRQVPADVTPERLTEIYITAIKEKNYPLYLECIQPSDRDTPHARDLCQYHWDWHQHRFAKFYCHIKVGEADVKLLKGLDTSGESIETKFLDPKQLEDLKKRSEPALYSAELTTQAFDERGNQYGTPKPRFFRKEGEGRWYIANFAQPF